MGGFLKISAVVLLMASLAGSYAWGGIDDLEEHLRDRCASSNRSVLSGVSGCFASASFDSIKSAAY